jgi:hypothetical protein
VARGRDASFRFGVDRLIETAGSEAAHAEGRRWAVVSTLKKDDDEDHKVASKRRAQLLPHWA